MHGIIYGELKKYVDARHGGDTWRKLLDAAGLGSKYYIPIQNYPDADAFAIVGAASAALGADSQAILEDFGKFIAPHLLALYRHLVKPEWRTLDVIQNAEDTIHIVVRVRNPSATPPELRCVRPSDDELILTYASQRKMCSVAKGIAKGLADHYHETVSVTDLQCMLKGDPECQISIKRT